MTLCASAVTLLRNYYQAPPVLHDVAKRQLRNHLQSCTECRATLNEACEWAASAEYPDLTEREIEEA